MCARTLSRSLVITFPLLRERGKEKKIRYACNAYLMQNYADDFLIEKRQERPGSTMEGYIGDVLRCTAII